ncbi:MAG TPA: hypothetical protein VFW09_06460 [Solirubrobacteraceae bacterium]|nr:hypothetical protein [Solirubrobacteraceae bacterium]
MKSNAGEGERDAAGDPRPSRLRRQRARRRRGPLSSNFARSGEGASWEGVEHGPLETGLARPHGSIAAFDCVVHERSLAAI